MNAKSNSSGPTPDLNVSVSKEDQAAAYNELLESEPFTPDRIGKTNPYTGEVIRTPEDYDLYLRERAFHIACSAKYSIAAAEAVARSEYRMSTQYKQAIDSSALSVETRVKAEQIRLDELDRQRRIAFERDYRLRCQKTFAVLALILILVSGIFSLSRYNKGYDAARDKYEDAAAVEYEKGYDSGYADGKNNYAASVSKGKSSSGRAEAAYSSAIIGNKNTKKFHSSDCSYLPNKNNQKPFDSYEDAVAAGYNACGHCGGR